MEQGGDRGAAQRGAQDPGTPGTAQEKQKQQGSPAPQGSGQYRLLHSGHVQVGLLVASGSGRDGRGARGLVN